MAKYKTLVVGVKDQPRGKVVDLDPTVINVIALILAGQVEPQDKDAKAHYDAWFYGEES